MKIKTIIQLVIIIAIVGIAYVMRDHIHALLSEEDLASDNAVGKKSVSIKVIIEPVLYTANDRAFEATGTGKARLSVNIYPLVTGEVVGVNFQAQDKVNQGDILLELDSREQKLAVRLAEVELTGAKNLLARYEQAVKDGAVPESEVDSARADVDAAQVALEQARVALDNREIKAPFTGVVGIPNIEIGDRVTTSTLITGLDDRDVLYVDFEIPEALAGRLQGNSTNKYNVTATTPAFENQAFNATVSAQESRLDSQKRTLLVRANIENENDLLRPGMSFRIRWNLEGKEYATVPEIALQWGREGSFIWVIRNGLAEKIPARVIARSTGQVLVDGEIDAGESVVTEGLQRLSPGSLVEILTFEK